MAVLPLIALAMTVAATAISAAGAMQQSKAQAQAANYNAAVQDQNTKLKNAEADVTQSKELAERRQLAGEQAAQAGAAGTGFTGSYSDILQSNMTAKNTDMELARYQTRVGNWNGSAQADLYRMQAKNSKTAGILSAVGTGLSGASKAYGDFQLMA